MRVQAFLSWSCASVSICSSTVFVAGSLQISLMDGFTVGTKLPWYPLSGVLGKKTTVPNYRHESSIRAFDIHFPHKSSAATCSMYTLHPSFKSDPRNGYKRPLENKIPTFYLNRLRSMARFLVAVLCDVAVFLLLADLGGSARILQRVIGT